MLPTTPKTTRRVALPSARTEPHAPNNRRRPEAVSKVPWRLPALRMPKKLVFGVVGLLLSGGLLRFAWDEACESSFFAISNIEVVGAKVHTTQDVETVLDGVTGQNLLSYDIDSAASTLLGLPYVSEVKLERELPNTLRVTLVEREPVAMLALGSLYLVDNTGVIFAKAEHTSSVDLPIITGFSRETIEKNPNSPKILTALSAIKNLSRLQAFETRNVAEIHMEENLGVSLVLSDGCRVRLGTVAEDTAAMAARLRKLDQIQRTLERHQTFATQIFLDNEVRPERVAVQLASEEAEIWQNEMN